MILRSVTRHVKDQNWFAVGIDFAIVVVGVFIGIQVANWNAMQTERDQAQRTLSAVLTDLVTLREELVAGKQHHLEAATSIDTLLSALEAAEQISPERAKGVLKEASTITVLPTPPAALDELLVGARLDLLGLIPLRDALRDLADSSKSGARFQTESLRIFNAALDEIYPHATILRTPGLAVRSYDISDVDIDAIWSSATARVAMTKFYVFHSNQWRAMQGLLTHIDEVFAEAQNVP
ncbi:hypothetical protein [Congregibacter litoralis]|uniref:Uncharacterized protein n=1 Tax=Congregibacter litoralis KT71 TaxID=314285 RepID=A4AC87_9GAMM|nr:hypothetical protein [Congregibacter litoralis]EAQ96315.1 hypothetical protein KT71_13050 [Congregibacter litoralis KT71]